MKPQMHPEQQAVKGSGCFLQVFHIQHKYCMETLSISSHTVLSIIVGAILLHTKSKHKHFLFSFGSYQFLLHSPHHIYINVRLTFSN